MEQFRNILAIIVKSITPIHKEGIPFIFIFGAVTILLLFVSENLGWLGLIATLWCTYFFRDPARVIPEGDNLVISPADGMIQKIESAIPPAELGLGEDKLTKISIFLNVFNVHVNRVPISGKVKVLNYRPGKFLSADLDKASEDNERQSAVVETNDGKRVVFIQIAGLIARRIVCDLTEEQTVKAGDRYGIIRFGSRVDVYLPVDSKVRVLQGQTAIGGETVLADL